MRGIVNKRGGRHIFKPEVLILYYALRNKQTPLYAKLPAVFSLVYLLSPVDIIPDVIPFFGYIDDLIIVPLLLQFCVKLLPRQVKEDSIVKATAHAKRLRILMVVFIAVAVLLLALIFMMVKRLLWP